ncbi:holin [Pseudomonas phage AH02]|nr:holin [Pseudomonas phage AH02]
MSAEVVVGAAATATATAAGVGVASVALAFDQSLVLASAGGAAMYLGVSALIPIQTRVFFTIGSFILGYLVGLILLSTENYSSFAALSAWAISGLGSIAFGSVYKWMDGGEKPKWIGWLETLSPLKFRKGDPNE